MANVDRIEIQHPCSASWAAMEGDDRARFCKLCSKVVHDTTALSTCELEKMLAAPTPPCLRVHRDRAGRVLTRDRLAALAFVGLAACSGGGDTASFDTAGGTSADAAAQVDRSSDASHARAGAHGVRAMGTGARSARGAGIVEAAHGGSDTTPDRGALSHIVEAVEDVIRPTMGEPAYVPEPAHIPKMGKPAFVPDELPVLMGGIAPPVTGSPAPAE